MLAMLFWSIAALQQVTFHAFETGTNENRFAIGISSHMISATKAIWIPLRLYGFYSHERHALIPISPVFISRGSNLGSHVARYSISTEPKSRHGTPEPLSIDSTWGGGRNCRNWAIREPLLAHQMGNSKVSNQSQRSSN